MLATNNSELLRRRLRGEGHSEVGWGFGGSAWLQTGRISHRFGDIAGFLPCRETPTLFNPNFGGVPIEPGGPCWVSPRAKALSYSAVKLFSKNYNLCDHDT